MHRGRTIPTLALATALLAGACGDDGGDEAGRATGQAAGGDRQRYCQLVDELDAAGEAIFADVAEDDRRH